MYCLYLLKLVCLRKQYQSTVKNSMKEPLRYTIGNLLSIVDDVEKRNYFYKKTVSLLHKKAEIDYNYANSIENLNKQFSNNNTQNLASQILYQKLLALIKQQPKRITQMADKIIQSVTELNDLADSVSGKTKKSLEEAQKMSKEINHLREKLQKLKPRIERKTNELQQMKMEYLGSMLGHQQLQKKNDLYLEVGKMQHALKPILEEYNSVYAKYSEAISQVGYKFNSFMQTIEEVELKKIAKVKSAVANYVYCYKLNLDSFLENYPFIRQQVDTVREKEQFGRHSRESLMVEGHQLNQFSLREIGYIDVIYDRIEKKKKNLQQIIFYGQNVEHKKNLNSIAEFNGENHISACMPKTSRMISLFRSIFEEDSNEEILYQMETLFKGDQKLRKDFIFCLQKYRISNEFELKIRNKQNISLCLTSFLDACALELDTYNSKMLMLLSVTYHFQDGDRKIELQELITDHPIWKNLGWWQSALFQTIYQETRVKVKKQEVAINIWDIKAGGINRKQENEEATNQNICFNQLIYFVQNMNLFNIPPQMIWNYAKRNNQLLKLPEKLAKNIMNMCPEQFSPSKKDKGLSPQCGTP